ncbi:YTH domain family protein 1 [Schistosoma japonicum]|nr:YTH domain family protein 1 [Schistosoma japonicum]
MASYATEMHGSPSRGALHNKQPQKLSDSYANKKQHSVTSQLQQQHSQYLYSDPYNFQHRSESNAQTLSNPETMNCVSSVYTNPEYDVNSPDLCTQTNQLQSYLHRVSCCLPQCPQCLSYNLFNQSYNFPNSGTTLQPSLVLPPTLLNNYSTSALCYPLTAQMPYYFWYNQDPEYQKQYYQTQLAMSKLNLDHTSPNTCMMFQSEPDSMHTPVIGQVHQTDANYSMDPSVFASVSLSSENVNTIVHPSSLLMPIVRSVAVTSTTFTTTVNSDNVSSKLNDPSLVNQLNYPITSSYPSSNSTSLNGYTALSMDNGVYDPANNAWYPGYWNSNNLWVSTATAPGSYLTPFNNSRSSLPMSSFSPNPQSISPDEYAMIHQQYVSSMGGDFSGIVNAAGNHPSTDLLTNFNQSRDRVVSQQSHQAIPVNNTAPALLSSSLTAPPSSSVMLTTSISSLTPTKLLSTQKECHAISYYNNSKSQDSVTALQNTPYCSYPPSYYDTNSTVNLINNNTASASAVTNNTNNNNTNNNMRLILTILANSRANTTAIATPNIVHSPYRYSSDRNSLLSNRQKLLPINQNSCNATASRPMCKTFSQSELARLNLNVNPVHFDTSLVHRARYFIIKSDYVYNVHQSIKYGVWCSTRTGNQCLDEAYQSVRASPVAVPTTSISNRNNNYNTHHYSNVFSGNRDTVEVTTGGVSLDQNGKLQSNNEQMTTIITTNNSNDDSSDVPTSLISSICNTTCTPTTTSAMTATATNNKVKFDAMNTTKMKMNPINSFKPVTTTTVSSTTVPTVSSENSSKSQRTLTSTLNPTVNSTPGHIILFFSVRESGYLTGVAEMTSPVNSQKRSTIWQDLRFRGEFAVRWLYIKHIPNHVIKHILVECYDNRPVTVLRDTSEILPPSKGEELLRIVHEYGLSSPSPSSSSAQALHSLPSPSSLTLPHSIADGNSSSKINNNSSGVSIKKNLNVIPNGSTNSYITTNTNNSGSNVVVPSSAALNNDSIVFSTGVCPTLPGNKSQVCTNVLNKIEQ